MATNFEVLEYCDYYKNLLVEELIFVRYPHKLHYGKCSVIGRIINESKHYFLENIRLNSLPLKYSIPDGCIKIRLLLHAYPRPPPTGRTCEIFGEAVLFDSLIPENEFELPLTSKDLVHQLENSNCTGDRYQPALLVHSLNIIDQARELIEKNLEIRALINKSK